jgi:hypothetical protein
LELTSGNHLRHHLWSYHCHRSFRDGQNQCRQQLGSC